VEWKDELSNVDELIAAEYLHGLKGATSKSGLTWGKAPNDVQKKIEEALKKFGDRFFNENRRTY
jgi:hypothetical protein